MAQSELLKEGLEPSNELESVSLSRVDLAPDEIIAPSGETALEAPPSELNVEGLPERFEHEPSSAPELEPLDEIRLVRMPIDPEHNPEDIGRPQIERTELNTAEMPKLADFSGVEEEGAHKTDHRKAPGIFGAALKVQLHLARHRQDFFKRLAEGAIKIEDDSQPGQDNDVGGVRERTRLIGERLSDLRDKVVIDLAEVRENARETGKNARGKVAQRLEDLKNLTVDEARDLKEALEILGSGGSLARVKEVVDRVTEGLAERLVGGKRIGELSDSPEERDAEGRPILNADARREIDEQLTEIFNAIEDRLGDRADEFKALFRSSLESNFKSAVEAVEKAHSLEAERRARVHRGAQEHRDEHAGDRRNHGEVPAIPERLVENPLEHAADKHHHAPSLRVEQDEDESEIQALLDELNELGEGAARSHKSAEIKAALEYLNRQLDLGRDASQMYAKLSVEDRGEIAARIAALQHELEKLA